MNYEGLGKMPAQNINYNDGAKSGYDGPRDAPVPMLQGLVQTLESENRRASDFISMIQDKLNVITDKRGQEKCEPVPSMEITDTKSSLGFQLNAMISNNRRLETILSHLSEII